MLDQSTEIELEQYVGSLAHCERRCRFLEECNFEVLSISYDSGASHFGGGAYLITMRVPKLLYVNYEASISPDSEWIGEKFQAGPYRGRKAAEQAERENIMARGLDKVRDSYITGQREHMRTFIGTDDA